MKVLMLILANDGGPNELYTHLQYRSWRNYMHSNPEIEAYFYKANPNLTQDYYFEGDVLWVKCIEQYPRLWNKHLLALRAFKERLNDFDYICRPDLGAFLVYDRYIDFIKSQPKTKMCCGTPLTESGSYSFPSGGCYTITPDIVKYIFENPNVSTIDSEHNEIDDIRIGAYLNELKINIIPDGRCVIYASWQYPDLYDFMNDKQRYYVRIYHQTPRLERDIDIHTYLLSIFYPQCHKI
jgi:hypothetical protein